MEFDKGSIGIENKPWANDGKNQLNNYGFFEGSCGADKSDGRHRCKLLFF